MNIALWVIQVLLALAFIAAGLMKATRPLEKLQPQMPWTKDVSLGLVRVVGVAEILGGVGLILPLLTGVQPWLTPLAAVGLVVVMLLAAAFHVSRREVPNISMNLVLAVLAAFVVYGRALTAAT